MTAPMRSVPAMPPVFLLAADMIQQRVGRLTGDWSCAELAYCEAQAAADRDGKRRRVFKVGDVWRIEVA